MAPPQIWIGNPSKRAKTGESSRRPSSAAVEDREAAKNFQAPSDRNPRLTDEQILTLRKSVKPDNVKWAKGNDRTLIAQIPSSSRRSHFLNKFGEEFYDHLVFAGKKFARTKICKFETFPVRFRSLVEHFIHQGWASLWVNPFTYYDDEIIRLFYCNMWVEFDCFNKPIAINSFVKGRHFRWTPNRICVLLGVATRGFDDLACIKWSDHRLGVSLSDVKNFLGIGPGVSTTNMSDEFRVVCLIVSYCICGKEAKLPSNLDYFITYKILKHELVNFGAIFISSIIDVMTLPAKNFTLGNLICQCLMTDGIPFGEFIMESHLEAFDRANIEQMVRIRRHSTSSAKGKEKASTSEPIDVSDDAEAERLAAGVEEITGEDDDDDDDDGDREGYKVPRHMELFDWDDVVDEMCNLHHDICKELKVEKEKIERLTQRNEQLEKENSTMKKSIGKLKKFIKELLPTAYFSSDEE